MEKVIGQACPECQSLFVQGPKGVYCKNCYIKWKNSKPQSTPQNAPQVNSEPNIAYTNPITSELKEYNSGKTDSMKELNAKKGAADIIAHHPAYKDLDKEGIPIAYADLANKIYNTLCVPFD